MLARAIRTALRSSVSSVVYVSTDDDEIATAAEREGAVVIHRPQELATDTASTESVLLHAADLLNLTDGHILLIQPTSPFLEPDDIVSLLATSERCDSALTVMESHKFIWRASESGGLRGINHDERKRLRRQDLLHQEYAENGAAYLVPVQGLRETKSRFSGVIGFTVMPILRSLEIDTPEDLLLANIIADVLRGAQPQATSATSAKHQ